MPKIVPIVEGDGEVTAVPVLLRKILWQLPRYDIEVARPKNANGRGNLTKKGGIEKFIRYSWKERDSGAILVLIDADTECPLALAQDLTRRVQTIGILLPVVIVVAKRMYESWFLASISTIAGHLDLPDNLLPPPNIEDVPNPKAWIEGHFPMGRAYKETQDQEAMTNLMSIDLATAAPSFQRMLNAINEALEAIDNGERLVTPQFD